MGGSALICEHRQPVLTIALFSFGPRSGRNFVGSSGRLEAAVRGGNPQERAKKKKKLRENLTPIATSPSERCSPKLQRIMHHGQGRINSCPPPLHSCELTSIDGQTAQQEI